MLSDEARETHRLGQGRALAIDPRSLDPWIVGTREADNERAAVFWNGLEVVDVGVPPIREQQAVFQRRWLWKDLSFGFLVGCELDATDFVGEPTGGRVQLDRGGIRRREPARARIAQLLLERERRAVLDHDVLEPRDGRLALRGECPEAQASDEPIEHPRH